MEKELIPKNVASYIDYCKENKFTLFGALSPIGKFGEPLAEYFKGDVLKCSSWAKHNSDEFAKARVNGYRILEPRYQVKVEGITGNTKYLVYGEVSDTWYFSNDMSINIRTYHTKKELEDAGFGWVFHCNGIKLTEVYKGEG